MPSPPWIIVQFLSTASGQDKACKTVQYFGKVVVWMTETFGNQIFRNAAFVDFLLDRFPKVIKSLSTTRAVLRLSNIYKDVQTLSGGSKETNSKLWFLEILDMTNSVVEDVVDWVIWGLKIHIIKWNTRRWSYLSSLFWFIQLCFSGIGYIREWKRFQLNPDVSPQKLFQFKLNIIKIFADFACCGPDVFVGRDFEPLSSICGFVSALIGSYQLWDKLIQPPIETTQTLQEPSPSILMESSPPSTSASTSLKTEPSTENPEKTKKPIPPERVVKRRDSLFFANK